MPESIRIGKAELDGVRQRDLRRRRSVARARRRLGQDAGLGQPARHQLARHHPHSALHRSDQGQVDQRRAQHPRRAQARRRGGAGGRPRAGRGGADARHGRGDRCAREVGVGWCAARNITHTGAIGYFALQAAEAGFVGIVMSASGPMMAYPGTRVRGGVVQSDRVRGAAQERPALSARLLHRRRRQRQDHGARPIAARKFRSAGASTRTATTPPIRRRSRRAADGRRQGRRPVVHDRMPDQPAAVASAHRAGPGELGDRRRSVPQRLGDRDRSRRVRRPRPLRSARPSGSAPPSPASPAPTASTRSCCPASAATPSAPSARPRAFPSRRARGNVSPRPRRRLGVTPPM